MSLKQSLSCKLTMKTNRVKNDPSDREEIDLLHKLIEVADYSYRSRTELLFRLGFVTGWRWLYKLNSYFLVQLTNM